MYMRVYAQSVKRTRHTHTHAHTHTSLCAESLGSKFLDPLFLFDHGRLPLNLSLHSLILGLDRLHRGLGTKSDPSVP